MKNKKITSVISAMLVVAMIFGFSVGSFAASGTVTYKSGEYELSKLSHPAKGSGEIDGIVDYTGNGTVSASDNGQGDRGQN